MRARIQGTGSFVPARVLTNVDLERMVETSDAWIVERTGIRERRIAASGESCSDLAVKAAERALEAAGVAAVDLDLILVATCTGDAPLPATACVLQHRLGAQRAAACDISAACSGFIYALAVGSGTQDNRAGSIAEEDTGTPIRPVHEHGHDLGAHDQHLPIPGAHIGVADGQGIDESRAGC